MARQFSNQNEAGAITSYLVSVVLMAILLIGGVLLLKNNSSSESGDVPNETATVTNPDSSDKTDDTNKDDSDKDETASTDKDSSSSNSTNSSSSQQTSLPGDIASTGDTSPETPDKIVATGPVEDFLSLLFGLLVATGAIYTAWNYRLSRIAVKAALLNK